MNVTIRAILKLFSIHRSISPGESPHTAAGTLTIDGSLQFAFLQDPSAKTTEWAIAKHSGATYTVLASGSQSIAANEAKSVTVSKTVNLASGNYPSLAVISLQAGDSIIWSHRITALGGSNGVQMQDNQMNLHFKSASDKTAVHTPWGNYAGN